MDGGVEPVDGEWSQWMGSGASGWGVESVDGGVEPVDGGVESVDGEWSQWMGIGVSGWGSGASEWGSGASGWGVEPVSGGVEPVSGGVEPVDTQLQGKEDTHIHTGTYVLGIRHRGLL